MTIVSRRVRSVPVVVDDAQKDEQTITRVRRVRPAVQEELYEQESEDTPDTAMEGESEDDACARINAKYKAKATSPTKAIRAFCIHCMGGYVRMVKDCTAPNCVLYPFRMGNNPFHGRAKKEEA